MAVASGEQVAVRVATFLDQHRQVVVDEWAGLPFFRPDGARVDEVHSDCDQVLEAVRSAVLAGAEDDPSAAAFEDIRGVLAALAAGRPEHGFGAAAAVDTRRLKLPLLQRWQEGSTGDDDVRVLGAVALSTAVDTLRLVLFDVALASRLDTIAAQREQLAELSTPVIQLWEGVLAVPLIGTLDSVRSQTATEGLLQAIADQQAKVAILDITGVPTVDTMVAQHLLRTAMAARLMGAECVISGIRPQIAQTMVQLGVDLGEVATRARLSDALAYALARIGVSVDRAK